MWSDLDTPQQALSHHSFQPQNPLPALNISSPSLQSPSPEPPQSFGASSNTVNIARASEMSILLWQSRVARNASEPPEDGHVSIEGSSPRAIAQTIADLLAFNSSEETGPFNPQPGVECSPVATSAFFNILRRIKMYIPSYLFSKTFLKLIFYKSIWII